MDEAEWLKCADATRMLDALPLLIDGDATGMRQRPEVIYTSLLNISVGDGPKPIRAKASSRKMRLFNCAFCRLHWIFISRKGKEAVEILEQFVDGFGSTEEANRAVTRARVKLFSWEVSGGESQSAAANAIRSAPDEDSVDASRALGSEAEQQEVKATLLRDIFGNPFRPVTLDPAWLTPTVRVLAQGIYDERGFDRMPILADALEDAGCTDLQMLEHCRGKGPHVRGCFAIDLLLGKS